MHLFLTSPVFIYPEMLPDNRFIDLGPEKQTRVGFSPAEDTWVLISELKLLEYLLIIWPKIHEFLLILVCWCSCKNTLFCAGGTIRAVNCYNRDHSVQCRGNNSCSELLQSGPLCSVLDEQFLLWTATITTTLCSARRIIPVVNGYQNTDHCIHRQPTTLL